MAKKKTLAPQVFADYTNDLGVVEPAALIEAAKRAGKFVFDLETTGSLVFDLSTR